MKKKAKHIDFWFSIGSTYTYLTISRLRKIIKQNKINIIYKPFNVRIIMLEMNNKPFSPSKRSKIICGEIFRGERKYMEFLCL